MIVMIVYVDDIITAGKDGPALAKVRAALHHKFNMDDGGKLHWYLGMNFKRLVTGGYSMDQTQYALQKLEKNASFISANPNQTYAQPFPDDLSTLLIAAKSPDAEIDNMFPYRSLVGELMYMAVATRPNHIASLQRSHCTYLEEKELQNG